MSTEESTTDSRDFDEYTTFFEDLKNETINPSINEIQTIQQVNEISLFTSL